MVSRATVLALWVCFVASLFCVFQFLLQGSTSLMVSALIDDFSINLKDIGFLSSAFFYPYLLLQVPSGILVDRYGPRKVLICASLLLSLSTLFFSLSKGYYSAELARVLMGCASAPGVIACLELAAILFPSRFVIMAGFIEMMALLGGALGDIWLSSYISHHGWRYAMLTCSISGFLIFLGILFFVRIPVSYTSHDSNTNEVEAFSIKDYFVQARKLLSNFWILRSCLYGAFIFSLISAFASLWSIVFLTIKYPQYEHLATSATSLIFLGAAAGAVGVGVLSKQQGVVFIMRLFGLLSLIIFSAIVFLSFSFTFVHVLFFLLGVSSGAYILPFEVVRSHVPVKIQGTAMGLANMFILLIGGPLLQPLIGWILDLLSDNNASQSSVLSFQIALTPIIIGLAVACLFAFLPKKEVHALESTNLLHH